VLSANSQTMIKLDFTKIDGVPHTKTITVVNKFVINTSQFLNKFSYLCEQKLAEVSKNIQRLEIMMNILEAKLSSIPGLESVQVAPAYPDVGVDIDSSGAPPPLGPEGIPIAPSLPDVEQKEVIEESISAPPVADFVKMKDDPRYIPFFKMLRLGVHPLQIRMDMQAKGRNPDFLQTPDAPAPPPDATSLEEEEEEESDEED